MENKKSILIMFVIAAAITSILLFFINKPVDFSSFIAVGSSVENYEQQQDIGYITVKFDHMNNTKKVLKVEDKELQSKLQQTNLSDVIGANMIMTIPAKELKNFHTDFKNVNIFNLLNGTDQYDKYITVTDIFFE